MGRAALFKLEHVGQLRPIVLLLWHPIPLSLEPVRNSQTERTLREHSSGAPTFFVFRVGSNSGETLWMEHLELTMSTKVAQPTAKRKTFHIQQRFKKVKIFRIRRDSNSLPVCHKTQKRRLNRLDHESISLSKGTLRCALAPSVQNFVKI